MQSDEVPQCKKAVCHCVSCSHELRASCITTGLDVGALGHVPVPYLRPFRASVIWCVCTGGCYFSFVDCAGCRLRVVEGELRDEVSRVVAASGGFSSATVTLHHHWNWEPCEPA